MLAEDEDCYDNFSSDEDVSESFATNDGVGGRDSDKIFSPLTETDQDEPVGFSVPFDKLNETEAMFVGSNVEVEPASDEISSMPVEADNENSQNNSLDTTDNVSSNLGVDSSPGDQSKSSEEDVKSKEGDFKSQKKKRRKSATLQRSEQIVPKKPKVIVEMSHRISLYDVTALQTNDSDNDMINTSDHDYHVQSPSIVRLELSEVNHSETVEKETQGDSSNSSKSSTVPDLIPEPMETSKPISEQKKKPRKKYTRKIKGDRLINSTDVNLMLPTDDAISSSVHPNYQDKSDEEVISKSPPAEIPLETEESPPSETMEVKVPRLDLNFCIKQGKGVKLKYIDHIATEIRRAHSQRLSEIHHILFDIQVPNPNSKTAAIMANNILEFSGFCFSPEKSCAFVLKRLVLKRLRPEVLNEIADMFLGGYGVTKKETGEKILDFLTHPTKEKAEQLRSRKRKKKHLNEEERIQLVKDITEGKAPYLQVRVEKLDLAEFTNVRTKEPVPESSTTKETGKEKNQHYPTCLNRLFTFNPVHSTQDDSNNSALYNERNDDRLLGTDKIAAVAPLRPPCAAQGAAKALKSFPEIARNIRLVGDKTIRLIHMLIFGTADEIEICRNKILEFRGFSDMFALAPQKRQNIALKFLEERVSPEELQKMCLIFCLPFDQDKSESIQSLIAFLQQPHGTTLTTKSEDEFTEEIPNEPTNRITLLRSYDQIRLNIECATPDDLVEFHDILYLKTCDSLEVHQRILDFNGFQFDCNSPEYQSRKTLMCYISMTSLKRIARILGLTDSPVHMHKEDLAVSILKALMELKMPETHEYATSTTSNVPKLVASSRGAGNSSTVAIPRIDAPENIENSGALAANDQNCAIDYSYYYMESEQAHVSSTDPTYVLLSSSDDEDSLVFADRVGHPSDAQLKKDIQEIIFANLHTIRMSSFIRAVMARYPNFDLRYRKKFIRSTATKVLSSIRLSEPS